MLSPQNTACLSLYLGIQSAPIPHTIVNVTLRSMELSVKIFGILYLFPIVLVKYVQFRSLTSSHRTKQRST